MKMKDTAWPSSAELMQLQDHIRDLVRDDACVARLFQIVRQHCNSDKCAVDILVTCAMNKDILELIDGAQPVPTDNKRKCIPCGYRNICKWSLAKD